MRVNLDQREDVTFEQFPAHFITQELCGLKTAVRESNTTQADIRNLLVEIRDALLENTRAVLEAIEKGEGIQTAAAEVVRAAQADVESRERALRS